MYFLIQDELATSGFFLKNYLNGKVVWSLLIQQSKMANIGVVNEVVFGVKKKENSLSSKRFALIYLKGTTNAVLCWTKHKCLSERGASLRYFTSVAMETLWILVLLSTCCYVDCETRVRGAGASFPSEVYKAWMVRYAASRQRFTTVTMTYEAVGSGGGKRRIKKASSHSSRPHQNIQ